MEALEIIIFLGLGILLGVFIIGFLTGWDYFQGYKDMKDIMMKDPDKVNGFEKVNKARFVTLVYDFFSTCRETGFNNSQSLYLNDNGTLSKQELFVTFKNLGWCESIQSKNFSCGEREDVVMNKIILPRIVHIECNNSNIIIR